MLRYLVRHTRHFTLVNYGRRWISIPPVETDGELYLPGTTLQLQFQLEGCNTFEPLPAKIVKPFKPFTSAVVLLVQRLSDNVLVMLKLADRRLGYRSNDIEVPWTSSIEDRLRHAVCDIQAGSIPDWIELLRDDENPKRPDEERWEDWAWEISTWYWKLYNYDTELDAYRLLHRLQGLALEYIPGISMEKLNDISQQEAEAISGQVMEGLRAIEAENHVLHNDIHIGNVVLRQEDRSAVIIDFGQAIVREPGRSDEDWMRVVRGGSDTRFMRRILKDPENGGWKRTVTPFEMTDSSYNSPLKFNDYVESMPDDFRMVMFDRVLDTDWEGAREKVHQWRIRPGVRWKLGTSGKVWMSIVWGGPDTRHIRRVLAFNAWDWKRNITPLEISDIHYDSRLTFNEVLDTGWDGAREKGYRWRIKTGARCRPWHD
ncbi:hypothetical protein EDD85DRAFT_968404 [Armillaria nabsnona]|nr:hypothetical protein EDD85DRAFT_968404 [Armillaria nabsnona]